MIEAIRVLMHPDVENIAHEVLLIQVGTPTAIILIEINVVIEIAFQLSELFDQIFFLRLQTSDRSLALYFNDLNVVDQFRNKLWLDLLKEEDFFSDSLELT